MIIELVSSFSLHILSRNYFFIFNDFYILCAIKINSDQSSWHKILFWAPLHTAKKVPIARGN